MWATTALSAAATRSQRATSMSGVNTNATVTAAEEGAAAAAAGRAGPLRPRWPCRHPRPCGPACVADPRPRRRGPRPGVCGAPDRDPAQRRRPDGAHRRRRRGGGPRRGRDRRVGAAARRGLLLRLHRLDGLLHPQRAGQHPRHRAAHPRAQGRRVQPALRPRQVPRPPAAGQHLHHRGLPVHQVARRHEGQRRHHDRLGRRRRPRGRERRAARGA
mmetsp:Transcript_19331/g.60046  ORF Transcript_19331/g.60046 Transcript_19331/m.60046 type:complete len:216 (-) Transcript_19331:962-1609(-)